MTAARMGVRGSPLARSSHMKPSHVTKERRKQQPKPGSSESGGTPSTSVEVMGGHARDNARRQQNWRRGTEDA